MKIQAAVALGRPTDALRTYDQFAGRGGQDLPLLAVLSTAFLEQTARAEGSPSGLAIEAQYRLARSGNQAARGELERKSALGGSDSQSLPLLTALARLGDAKAGAWFADRVRQTSGGDRVDAIRTLADLRLAGQAAVLVDLLSDRDPNTRAVAAQALGSLEYRAALPALKTLLGDAIPAVKLYAAVAVKRLGDPSANAQVTAWLNSPVPEMRLIAASAYQGASTTEWVAPVRELLGERNVTTRIRAAELISCCDKVSARSTLVAIIDGGNPVERTPALRVLEEKALADAPLVRRLLGSDDPWVRLHAAGAALNAAQSTPSQTARER